MKMTKVTLYSAVSAVFMATAAAAAPVTINFDGLGAENGSENITIGGLAPGLGGLSLTLDADTFRLISQAPQGPADTFTLNGDDTAVLNTTQGGGDQGIGVLDAADNNDDVDGFGDNDIVLFNFSRSVSLLSIRFDNVQDPLLGIGNGADDFLGFASDAVLNPGDPFQAILTDIPNIIGDDGLFTLSAPGVAGSFFGIGALENNDSWRIRSITVDVAPIPLPAAFPLLLAGLGGLVLAGRRRRTS